MAWNNAPGTQRDLPPDWPQRVEAVKERAGGRCEQILPSGRRCPRKGRDVHHYGGPHEHDKLMYLCPRHHAIETNKQAVAARTKKPAIRQQAHPGAIPRPTGDPL